MNLATQLEALQYLCYGSIRLPIPTYLSLVHLVGHHYYPMLVINILNSSIILLGWIPLAILITFIAFSAE